VTTAPEQTPEGWDSGAEPYAEVFAPFTGRFATDAIERLGVAADDAVLDVAAGTGAFSLRAAAIGARVLATDFSRGMLGALAARAAAADLAVETAVMDGQDLDLEPDAFDVAASIFGGIFFPDADAGLRELARVTRPGGRMAVTSWSDDGPRLSKLTAAAVTAADPTVELPTRRVHAPLGTPDGCRETLAANGWRDVVVHELRHDLVVDDPPAFFRSMVQWSAPTRPIVAMLDADGLERAAAAFTAVVAERSPSGDRVPFHGLLSIGAPA
jgi:SAM-dependent methyltransferase